MLDEEQEFRKLLQGIQHGDAAAVRRFMDHFGPGVLKIIRRRLDAKLRRQFDSMDFLQDVMATVLCNPPEPEAFANADALYTFLTNVARNKVVTAQRHGTRPKYDVRREHSLDGSAQFQH